MSTRHVWERYNADIEVSEAVTQSVNVGMYASRLEDYAEVQLSQTNPIYIAYCNLSGDTLVVKSKSSRQPGATTDSTDLVGPSDYIILSSTPFSKNQVISLPCSGWRASDTGYISFYATSGWRLYCNTVGVSGISLDSSVSRGDLIERVSSCVSDAYPENGIGGGNYQLITFVPALIAAMTRKGVA